MWGETCGNAFPNLSKRINCEERKQESAEKRKQTLSERQET